MEDKERIYGEDPGCLDQETIDWLDYLIKNDPRRAEVAIYWLYEQINMFRRDCEKHYGDSQNLNEEESYLNANYARFYLMSLTRKFGVTFELEEGVKMCVSNSFQKWRNFWQRHIERLNSAGTFKQFYNALSYDGDITPYLPEKVWNEE